MDTDLDTVLEHIKRAGPFFDAYQVTTFACYRIDADGRVQDVTVRVMDAGPSVTTPRYQIVAVTKDGRTATGDTHDDLATALALVHWDELDVAVSGRRAHDARATDATAGASIPYQGEIYQTEQAETQPAVESQELPS